MSSIVELEVPTADDIELMECARAVIDTHTDAGPDEDGAHTMGAAVRDADGRMFAGVNLFHFTGGPCAELVALSMARAQGGRYPKHPWPEDPWSAVPTRHTTRRAALG